MYDQTENVGAGCMLPLLQSIAGGVFSGLVMLACALWAGWPVPGVLALVVGAIGAAAWWWTSVTMWRRAAYQVDALQPEPRPEPRPEPIRVELTDGKDWQFIDLPASVDQLTTLARGVLQGQTLSESAWTGGGQPFTRAEFASLRGELIRRGLASWNNPKTPARGVSLTRGGLAAMRTFASLTDRPTPRVN